MGLLDMLWDDTVAGPRPDSGLSKLRKYRTLSCSTRSLELSDEIPVTRSITILKTSNFRNISGDPGSLPSSPAGSSVPDSPFTPITPGADLRGMRRKSEPFERAEPRSPTVYDWVVISALDR